VVESIEVDPVTVRVEVVSSVESGVIRFGTVRNGDLRTDQPE